MAGENKWVRGETCVLFATKAKGMRTRRVSWICGSGVAGGRTHDMIIKKTTTKTT